MQRQLAVFVAMAAFALGAGHVVQSRAEQGVNRANDAAALPVSAVTPVAATDLPVTPLPAPMLKEDCPLMAQAIVQPAALLSVTLEAPCHAGERVVLRHSGLAVTAQISAKGFAQVTLPALTVNAEVEALLATGARLRAQAMVPEVANLRRFAVQWQASDAFQLHAFAPGAGYGDPGHYSAAFTGRPGQGPSVLLLGDSTTALPLLAEVFTFDREESAEIVLESAVTEATCGRDLLAETILAEQGQVTVAELTLAMPECDALGDIVVLRNLAPEMTVAAAE